MAKKQSPVENQLPDDCEVCGQKIDKRSRDSIDHHSTSKHMPYTGKRRRPGWL